MVPNGTMAEEDSEFKTDDLKRVEQPRRSVEDLLLSEEVVAESSSVKANSSKSSAMASGKGVAKETESRSRGPGLQDSRTRTPSLCREERLTLNRSRSFEPSVVVGEAGVTPHLGTGETP